jgi:hypothetical protein
MINKTRIQAVGLLLACVCFVSCGTSKDAREAQALADAIQRVSVTNAHYQEDRKLIARSGARAVPQLVGALSKCQLGSGTPRLNAIVVLLADIDRNQGRQAIVGLLRALDPNERQIGAASCSWFPIDDKLKAELLVATEDPSAGVRACALMSLMNAPSKEVDRQFLKSLHRGGIEAFIAAKGLANRHDVRALPVLRAHLSSSEASDRLEAAISVGKLGRNIARKELTPLLRDADSEVRHTAQSLIDGTL